jgi:hypothetical protein
MFEDITHPFLNINDLSELSIEDLQTKISEVLSRLNFCYGTNNQQLINQLTMVLNTYQEALHRKLNDTFSQSEDDGNDLGDKIDIS